MHNNAIIVEFLIEYINLFRTIIIYQFQYIGFFRLKRKIGKYKENMLNFKYVDR